MHDKDNPLIVWAEENEEELLKYEVKVFFLSVGYSGDENGFITKVNDTRRNPTTKFCVFLGAKPNDVKKPAAIITATLSEARTILGHTISHPVKLTTPKVLIKGPGKGK